VSSDAAWRYGTVFFGFALAGIAQWNGCESSAVLGPVSSSYQVKKHTAAPGATAHIADDRAGVIDACRTSNVGVQLKYFDMDGDVVSEFTVRTGSTPRKREGLYWPIAIRENENPVDPNDGLAVVGEQEPRAEPHPFAGYLFRTLPAPGLATIAGARDDRVNAHYVSGFALIAWPAQYGVSGVQTFVINLSGQFSGRAFGPNTPPVAFVVRTFDTYHNWKRITSADDEKEAFT
jgi:hypothetical protein